MATSSEPKDEKPSGDQAILEEARERLRYAQEAWHDIYAEALNDLEFKNGDQWPAAIRKKREAENRPCLTINRLAQFIKQVVGDQRQNRPTIKIMPAEGGDVKAAEIREGLIRQIQNASKADTAYDMAFEMAASCSIGFFRINIEYASDDAFDQDLTIRRIVNPLTTYIDPTYQEADASDMAWGFVLEWMSRDKFKGKYPGKEPASFDYEGLGDYHKDWITEKQVMVCEYWRKVPDTKELLLLSNGAVMAADLMTPEREIQLADEAVTVIAKRTVKCYRVESYVLSADQVLESAKDYPGKYIPIIPVFGEEDNVGGKRILRSLIRFGKDPQRMYNYWRTAATEMVALAKSAPWKVTPQMIEGHEGHWDNLHTDARAYVLYNENARGEPSRDQGPNIPSAFLTESRETADEMKSTIGIYDAGLGNQSNETSGRAILARQRESDTSTFAFVDNLSRAIAQAGRVLLDLLPYVYSNERVVRVLGEDGKSQAIRINQHQPGADARLYDMTIGKYDVVVKTGPSFATLRTEAANSMMEFVTAFPAAGPLVGDLIAQNMDWPGADQIAARLKTLLPPAVQSLEDKEGGGPPPEMVAMVQQLQQALQVLQQQLAEAQKNADINQGKLAIDAFKAETDRIKLFTESMSPEALQPLIVQTVVQTLRSPELDTLLMSGGAPAQSLPQ